MQEDQDLDHISEDQLGFAAITEGLGFHRSKKDSKGQNTLPKPQTHAGAVVAGQPRFNLDAVRSKGVPLGSQDPTNVGSTGVQSHSVNKGLSMLFLRSGAFLIDLFLLFGAFLFACNYLLIDEKILATFSEISGFTIALLTCYTTFYFLFTEVISGQSLGKIIFKLHVVDDSALHSSLSIKKILLRTVIFPISILPLFWGALISIRDSKYRQFHDKVSGTRVQPYVY